MAFKRFGRNRNAEGPDCARRPLEPVGEIVESPHLFLPECPHLREQARRLGRKQTEKLTLQVPVAKCLFTQMSEVDWALRQRKESARRASIHE
jgi:hypothetical protein